MATNHLIFLPSQYHERENQKKTEENAGEGAELYELHTPICTYTVLYTLYVRNLHFGTRRRRDNMRKFHRTFTAYLFLRCAFIERIGRTECCPRATENKLIPQIE